MQVNVDSLDYYDKCKLLGETPVSGLARIVEMQTVRRNASQRSRADRRRLGPTTG
jgi:hypothetical protein